MGNIKGVLDEFGHMTDFINSIQLPNKVIIKHSEIGITSHRYHISLLLVASKDAILILIKHYMMLYNLQLPFLGIQCNKFCKILCL